MRWDLGGLFVDLTATVKGLQAPEVTWVIGPTKDTTPDDRERGERPTYLTNPGKVDAIVNLQADKKVKLSTVQNVKDEMGNVLPSTDEDFEVAFEVDDESLINLMEDENGDVWAAAVGSLGTAVVTSNVTHTSTGKTGKGVLAIEVIPGDADTIEVTIEPGAPEEVTPDGTPTPPATPEEPAPPSV